MPELNNELREIYLEPVELHIAREPAIIRTALGACIGITSWSAWSPDGATWISRFDNSPGSSTSSTSRAGEST
jgi:hypothetical protein